MRISYKDFIPQDEPEITVTAVDFFGNNFIGRASKLVLINDPLPPSDLYKATVILKPKKIEVQYVG